MPANDPDVRKAIAAKMGRASMAGDPEELRQRRQAAAAAVNSPAALARRIIKAWPGLGRAERAEVRAILAELAPASRPRKRT